MLAKFFTSQLAYVFKVNNGNTRIMCEIWSSTRTTFIVNFEQVSHNVFGASIVHFEQVNASWGECIEATIKDINLTNFFVKPNFSFIYDTGKTMLFYISQILERNFS